MEQRIELLLANPPHTCTGTKRYRIDEAIRFDGVLIDGSLVPSLVDGIGIGLAKVPANGRTVERTDECKGIVKESCLNGIVGVQRDRPVLK